MTLVLDCASFALCRAENPIPELQEKNVIQEKYFFLAGTDIFGFFLKDFSVVHDCACCVKYCAQKLVAITLIVFEKMAFSSKNRSTAIFEFLIFLHGIIKDAFCAELCRQ